MIWFNGFPFLDNKQNHVFNVPVSHVMTNKPVFLPATNLPVKDAERLLGEKKFQGFPIVDNADSRTLIGFIGRTELQYAIARAKRGGQLFPDAKCRFVSPLRRGELPTSDTASTTSLSTLTPSPSDTSATQRMNSQQGEVHPARTFDDIPVTSGIRSVDFSPYIDLAPLTVHPRLPLETVMEIFKKMGPRVILVEHRGRLTGLVSVKDCLKYQFKVEAQEYADANANASAGGNGHGSAAIGEGMVEQKVWELIQWAIWKVKFWKRRDRSGSSGSHGLEGEWQRRGGAERASSDIVDGTEDADALMELEERDSNRG